LSGIGSAVLIFCTTKKPTIWLFIRKDYLQKHILKVHPELSLEELEQAHPNLYSIQETISVVEGTNQGENESRG